MYPFQFYRTDEIIPRNQGFPVSTQRNNDEDFYVGVYVFYTLDKMSYFLLFDDGKMIARLKLPYRVPFGFHALWITGDQLKKHVEHHNKTKSS